MFRAQNHVTLSLIKTLNRQTGVYFNAICSLVMDLSSSYEIINFRPTSMGQLCCMYPEACHDYWGGKPWYPIH